MITVSELPIAEAVPLELFEYPTPAFWPSVRRFCTPVAWDMVEVVKPTTLRKEFAERAKHSAYRYGSTTGKQK